MQTASRASTRVSLSVAAIIAALLPIADAGRAAGAAAPSAVCGTWVLQESSTVTDLAGRRTQIESALSLPGVTGFSLRFTWKAVDTDFSVLDAGLAIARSRGKAFTIRFMAGRHTPVRVFDAGSPFYVLASGEKVPSPFLPDGSPNIVFEQAYDEFLGRLAAWSRANGVQLLHMAWYGENWAELNHGAAVRAVPGYSSSNWLNSHRRLIDVAARHSGPDLAVELPLTGSGPLSNGPSAALADHIIATVGADSDRFFIQANGWGPNGEWGTTSATTEAGFDQIWPKPVRRGLQAIQPQDYDWTLLFGSLYVTGATYAEVYLPSFALARRDLLAAEIAQFAATRCALPPPPDTTPPEVTVSAPPAGGLAAGNVTVSIEAVDSGGAVTGVDLLVDGSVVGSAGPAPANVIWDSTAVADGAHELVGRASDGAGNVGVSAAVSVTVDNTAPDVPGGLTATAGEDGVTASFEAVPAPDLAGYDVRHKRSSASTWNVAVPVTSTTAPFTGLTAGTSYDFAVRSRDLAGNTSAWSEAVSAVVADGGAPDVSITWPVVGDRLGGTVDVAVGTSDNSESVIRVDLLVDGDPVAFAEPPTATIAWDTTAVPDGAHDLSARATDGSNNAGTSEAVSLFVDNTAPSVPDALSVLAGDGEVTVTFEAVADDDVEGYEVQTRLSSSSAWNAPVLTALTWRTFPGLTNGTSYDFSVRSRDGTGHRSAWSATVSATPEPDRRLPVVTITAPAGGARVAGTVDVVVDVVDDEGAVLVELLVDGEQVAVAEPPAATIAWDTTGETDGAHFLRARAVDGSGFEGTSESVAVTVDNTAPPVPGGVEATPGDGEVTVTFDAVPAADLAGYEVRRKLSASPLWAEPEASATTAVTFTGLANGTGYDFSVRSLDDLGNASAWSVPVSATPFLPDTRPPEVTLTAPVDGSRMAGSIDVSAATSDDGGSVTRVDLLVDGELAGSTTTFPATIGWDTNTVPDGSHVLSATAVDAAGNPGTSAPVTVTVDNSAPAVPADVVATPGNAQVMVGFSAVVADLSGYEARSKPSSSSTWDAPVSLSSTTFTFTGLANGTGYDFSVRSLDDLGNASAWSVPVSATPFLPDTRPPEVTLTAPVDGSTTAGTIDVSAATSDDGGSVTRVDFLVDGVLVGTATFPATIQWDTTTVSDGLHVLSATALDAAGNQGFSAPVTVTVDNTAPAVPGGVAVTPGNAQVMVGFNAVVATDLAGYEARSKPSSSSTWGTPVSLSSTTFTFTGLANGTTYDFSVRSLDTLGNASAWSAPVSTTPVAPDTEGPSVTITSPAGGARVTGTVGVAIGAVDSGGVARLELLVDGVLAGTATGATATITWNTRTVADGIRTVQARAFDTLGNAGVSALVSVTVDNTAPPVPAGVIATPGDRQVTVTFGAVGVSDLAAYELRMKTTSSSSWGTPVSTTTTSRIFTGLTNGTSYDFAVRSRDTLGQLSAWSATVSASPRSPDTQAPTTPSRLTIAQRNRTSIQICWTASTDNVGVTGYRVSRNGTLVATTTSTCYLVTGLNPNTTYTLSVRAQDAAGNLSGTASISARTRP